MTRIERPVVLMFCLGVVACGGDPPAPAKSPSPAPKPTGTEPPPPVAVEAEGACPKGMVLIPAGTLWLGTPAGSGAADEHPEQKLNVSEFCLDVREVSVADYRSCVKNKACDPLPKEVHLLTPVTEAKHESQSLRCSANLSDNDDLPATCVSAEDATRYCSWKGARLPSEPEWEWAATGGDDKLAWPWGAALPSDENACWGKRSPCRVASKKAETFELYDLGGGVAEWTSSAYGPLGGSAPDANIKVVRGGSWASAREDELRPEKRSSHPASYRGVELGFRCAKSR
ncbi:MAG: SUMF1/EgtB/PvdO family nonheme iron enzyme [Polyangiaceae bacterium]